MSFYTIYSFAQVQTPEKPNAILISSTSLVYIQNFDKNTEDGLKASSGLFFELPKGWAFAEIGDAGMPQVDGKYRAGAGISTVADTYSLGISYFDKDRALGSLTSVKLKTISLGCLFVNNSGKAITQLEVDYTGEQWRNGGSGKPCKLVFYYSTDAGSLLDGTWKEVKELNFNSLQSSQEPSQINGNENANKTNLNHSISGLSIPNKGKIWLKWENVNEGSKADGLGIDDIKITAQTK